MNINLISVPVLIMSALSLYVGMYHLWTYCAGLRDKSLIYFSLTCFSVALYALFCAGLYNADTIAEGMVWQRYQFASLAILSISMIWFIYTFTEQKSKKICYCFTLSFILFLILGFVIRNELTLSLANPLPRHVIIGNAIDIIYHECDPGLLYLIQYIVMIAGILHITYLLIKHHVSDQKRQSWPIVIAMLVFFIAAINDILVGSGVYPFIYVVEYFYFIIILSMSYVLLKRFVNFYVEIEDVNKNLERKVDNRTVELKNARDNIERAYREIEKRVEERTLELSQEISERLLAEKELRRLRNYMKNIIDSMPSMLVGVDTEGLVIQWNSKAEKITGISSHDALGSFFTKLFPQLPGTEEKIMQAIKEQQPQIDKKIPTEENGNKRLWDITFYPLVANGVEGAVIRLDDVTEFEKKEAQLRESQKMEIVGTLAGGLAHDFNNVLSGIVGTLSLMKYKFQEDGRLDKGITEGYLNTMEKSSQRAIHMVQQLLTFSRRQEVSLSPVDLNRLIQNVMEICSNTFDKSIKLSSHFQTKPAMINADPSQIEQVILNFCVNASHAMTMMKDGKETWGGVLNVSIESVFADQHFRNTHSEAEEKNYWKVSVKDTGIGMDSKTLTKIFNPFFTTKGQGKGTGLGLSMAYSILEQHHGFSDVYSEVGIGSIFNIYLPALERDNNAEVIMKEQIVIPRGEGLIFVVDDEEILRDYAKGVLEECGYEVLVAKNGSEGVSVFKEHHKKIKAVLLDMAMPGISGKDVYIKLKEIEPNIKVLLASGFRQDARVEDVLKLGVNGFIQKPYTLKNLAEAIHVIIKDPQDTIG